MQNIIKKIFIISLYLLSLAIILEVSSRIILFRFLNSSPPKINNSICWRLRWLKDHVKESSSFNLYDKTYVYDKTKGWNSKPNLIYARDNHIIRTNSKGLRGTNEHSYIKPIDRKRLVIIGDSFTFGVDSSDEEVFTHLLDEMMPDIDVLNLGVGGYGHDQILLKLKEEGIKYNPDMVMLLFMDCDMRRNILTFRDYSKPRYVLKNNSLTLTNVPVDTPKKIIRDEKFKLYLTDFLKIFSNLIKDKHGLILKEEIELTKALIKEMRNTCEKINAQFAIIAFTNEKAVIEKIKDRDTPLILIDPDSTTIPDNAFKGHWNASGHKLVAKEIFKGLFEHRLTSRNRHSYD